MCVSRIGWYWTTKHGVQALVAGNKGKVVRQHSICSFKEHLPACEDLHDFEHHMLAVRVMAFHRLISTSIVIMKYHGGWAIISVPQPRPRLEHLSRVSRNYSLDSGLKQGFRPACIFNIYVPGTGFLAFQTCVLFRVSTITTMIQDTTRVSSGSCRVVAVFWFISQTFCSQWHMTEDKRYNCQSTLISTILSRLDSDEHITLRLGLSTSRLPSPTPLWLYQSRVA